MPKIYGEQGHHEGEGVFGGCYPIARSRLRFWSRTQMPRNDKCYIHYRDIGGALKRKEKLEKLQEAKSISGFNDWQTIKPDVHHDWIGQRSDVFTEFYPLGTKEAKAGRADNAIFQLYSLGLSTNRDAYVYNFSRKVCAETAQRMTQEYLSAISGLEENPELTVDEVVHRYTENVKWNRELKDNLSRRRKTTFDDNYIRKVMYRPFIATHCYADYTFIAVKGQMDRIFPDSESENRVIQATGTGSKILFSAFMTNTMLDLETISKGKCFPRWRYPQPTNPNQITSEDKLLERIDNISDTALRAFREHYKDNTITKDAIFDYVYGILHAPCYREQFASDLLKEIPRIPYAPDFRAFAEAGKALADLHLNYETCERYPNLKVGPRKQDLFWEEKPEDFLLGTRAMRFTDKNTKDTLIINEHVQLSGIPEEAHRYVVNGRTPLEWFMNRYVIKLPEKNNGILNDANGWFEKPRDLITAIERIVYVSVESTKIIRALPTEVVGD